MGIFNNSLNYKDTFEIYLTNPDEILFKGKAIGFASTNETGDFSIISKHTNYRSLVRDKITIYLENKTKKEFKINEGVLSFSNNNLEVYVI